jgi:hypothetical protein
MIAHRQQKGRLGVVAHFSHLQQNGRVDMLSHLATTTKK